MTVDSEETVDVSEPMLLTGMGAEDKLSSKNVKQNSKCYQ